MSNESTTIGVPREVGRWALQEAARRTARTGERVTMADIVREAIEQYRQRCELGSMPWPPAEAYHKAFVEKSPAPVEAPADDHHRGER